MSGPLDASLSLSELRALVTKAARGAGMEWGLAEEAGWAAEWLARRGLPAAGWAADMLLARAAGAACPVATGTALADSARAMGQGGSGSRLPDGLPAPGYLLPFVHLGLAPGQSMTMSSPEGPAARIASTGAVALDPAWQDRTLGWTLVPGADAAAATVAHSRAPVSRAVLECLETLALKTTVPPSASSRGDAGSQGGDND